MPRARYFLRCFCRVVLASAMPRLAFAQNFRQSSKRSVRMLSVFLARCMPSIRYGLYLGNLKPAFRSCESPFQVSGSMRALQSRVSGLQSTTQGMPSRQNNSFESQHKHEWRTAEPVNGQSTNRESTNQEPPSPNFWGTPCQVRSKEPEQCSRPT